METIHEQDIEKLLINELHKLKKAVAYIEEAKETAKNATNLLSEMSERYNAINKSQAESDNVLVTVNKQLKEVEEKILNISIWEQQLSSKMRYFSNIYESVKEQIFNIKTQDLTNLTYQFKGLESITLTKIKKLELQIEKDLDEIKLLKQKNQSLSVRSLISLIISIIAIAVAVSAVLS